ncbi:MAG: hypothetical protein ACC667_07980 [Longimicrobiales bacterium]
MRPLDWTSMLNRFTRRGTRVLVGLVVLLALPPAARAQQDRLARLREAYSPEAMARIESIVTDARRAGVPIGPIYNKALEGAAKGVPANLVVPALSEFAGRMGRARELLGPTAQSAWVVAGADALKRGVAPELVASIGRDAANRAPIALLMVGDLVEAGVPADRALEVLREALSRTRGEDELRDVPATIRRLVRQGSQPRDAVRDVLDAMRRGTPLRRLHRRPPRLDLLTHRPRPVPPGSRPARDARRTDSQRGVVVGGRRPGGG